jgi:hypothetical protein
MLLLIQKNKRLALLSEMRTRSAKKEAVSTMGVSEVGMSNSAVESPHSSDSYYPRYFCILFLLSYLRDMYAYV